MSANPVVYGFFTAFLLRLLLFENFSRPLRGTVPAAIGLCSAAAFLIIFYKRKKNYDNDNKAVFLLAALSAGFLLSSGFSLSSERNVPWTGLPAESVSRLLFTSKSDSRKISSGGWILEAELSEVGSISGARAEAGGNLLCFFNSNPQIAKGEIISAETSLGIRAELAEVYKTQNLGDISMLKAPLFLTAFPKDGAWSRLGYSSAAAGARDAVLRKIEKRCMDMGDDSGGLLLALLLGRRDELSSEENRIFREAGCSHILALSGMHLGILSGILLLLLRPLPGRKTAFIISLVLILIYLILTGFGTSLVRAAIMYLLFGLSHAFYRKTSGMDVLLLSFIFLTALSPASFFTLSFQLSFLAVAGILIASPEINILIKPWLPSAIRLPLSVSAGAQLFVMPLLLYTFGVIYPAGLVAGILIAPMVTLFIWSGLLFLISGIKVVSIFSDIIYKSICLTAQTASAVPSVSYGESAYWLVPLLTGLTILLALCSIRRRLLNGISGKL